jgi:cobalt/nickel transport system permease protein
MHIGEGILSATPAGQGVLLVGAVAAAAGTFVGLRRLDEEQIPKAAVLGSAFFIAASIQVPVGAHATAHLILSGLMGLVLGWAVFPVVLVGLILQMAFFSIGGPTVLGLNTVVMALPGVVCYYVFGAGARGGSSKIVYAAGFSAGSLGVILGALLSSFALLIADQRFALLASGFFALHLLVALVEGLVTGSVIVLLRQVRPAVLRAPVLAPLAEKAADG